jgi:hypothetical protein
MRKAALSTIGALLIAGSAVQMASASEHHIRRGYDRWDFRQAHNQWNGPFDATPQRDVYHELYGRHGMPAEDAIRFGYGNAYPTYHSGWGGLYGDGDYPGSVDDNMGPPYWDR